MELMGKLRAGVATSNFLQQPTQPQQRVHDLEKQLRAKEKEVAASKAELDRKEALLRLAAGWSSCVICMGYVYSRSRLLV